MAQSDDRLFLAIRARVRRKIQTTFAIMAFAMLALAILVNAIPGFAGLGAAEKSAIANAFLFLGMANALTMHAWDWLFWNDLKR